MEKVPYLVKVIKTKIKLYNPKYGDDKVCICGHFYYRHFDTYDNMYNCGCKYCNCKTFEKKK